MHVSFIDITDIHLIDDLMYSEINDILTLIKFITKNYDLLSFIKVRDLRRTAREFKSLFDTFIYDPSLDDFSTRIIVNYISEENKRLVNIIIPKNVKGNYHMLLRIFNCYSFWLPFLLEMSESISYSFQLDLNASDWGQDGTLSMTGKNINYVIPDEYSMFESQKINKLYLWKEFDQFSSHWLSRKEKMFWRGSTTGPYINSLDSLKDLDRVKICLRYSQKKDFDMRITNIVQNNIPKKIVKQWLDSKDIRGSRVRESEFIKYRFYPDISGNNLLCGSWGVIRKFLRGNLVFKPEYQSKMYYDSYMIPGKHYLTVQNDFSDLQDKLIWAKNNYQEAVEIAWNGYCVAKESLLNLKTYFVQRCSSNIIKL